MAEYTVDKIEYGGNIYKLQDNESGFVTTEVFYGTCATGASTAAKVVTCETFTSSDLKPGVIIIVNFSVTNSAAVGDLTLNVNSTGAKKIQYINNGTRGNLSNAAYLKASTSYPFIYDGTYWLAQINYNSNTTYSAGTAALIEAGTDTSNRVWQAQILHDYITAVAGNGAFIGTESTTFNEFKAAIEAGKAVFLEIDDDDDAYFLYPLTYYDLSETQYRRLEFTGYSQVNSSTVTVGRKTLDGNGTWDTSSVAAAPKASPALTGTPTAPTATAGTNTTQIATTAFVKTAIDNGALPKTTTTPKMDGTAAIGSETKYAAGDHVHPSDTTKADKSATVSTVAWDSTNKKLTKTINGTTSDVVTAATLRTDLNVANGAEVNQNAFSNVKVGSTTIAADSKTDTLELVAGSHISLVPNSTDDKVTFNVGWPYEGSLSILETGTDTNQRTWPADAIADYVNEVGEAVVGLIPNTFSNVKVGSTTIAADSKTDTLELVAGTGVTLTPDATNDKVTISATSSGGGLVNLQDGTGTGSIEMSNASAVKSYQTALGKYNKEDTGTDKDLSNFALIIGNGTDSTNRSNLFTINNSGLVTTHPASNTDYDWDTSTPPDETQYFTGFEIRDTNEVRLAHVDAHAGADSVISAVLGAEKIINGEPVRNQIYLRVEADGRKTYVVDEPGNFRYALGFRDAVIEQGTSGIWTYRKWSSGIAECWGTYSKTVSHYNTVLGGYAYTSGTVNFPSGLFVSAPICTYTSRVNNGMALTGTVTTNLTKDSNTYYTLAQLSGNQTCYWYIYAVGRHTSS